ncbi:MAG: CGNR zinc finger domain-containing protein [Candidatus Limnocylindria bacterium]
MNHTHDGVPEPNQQQELFVAFANTLEHSRGVSREAIPDTESLLSWLRDRGLISARARTAEAARLRRDPSEADRRLQRFRRLREVLHGTAADIAAGGRPSPAHVAELNHILRHGLHYHQLRHDPRATSYEVTQVGDRLDQARAAIAGSFAHFLADGAAERLRVCANAGCRYVFVDRSPTGRRRWCDMRTCGNQAKVARHRARARQGPQGVSRADASV